MNPVELKEGIYALPPELKAQVIGGDKVIVEKRKGRPKRNVLHCSDCVHRKVGRKVRLNQYWDSGYCEMKPKTIDGRLEYFYCAPENRLACDMFEPIKED